MLDNIPDDFPALSLVDERKKRNRIAKRKSRIRQSRTEGQASQSYRLATTSMSWPICTDGDCARDMVSTPFAAIEIPFIHPCCEVSELVIPSKPWDVGEQYIQSTLQGLELSAKDGMIDRSRPIEPTISSGRQSCSTSESTPARYEQSSAYCSKPQTWCSPTNNDLIPVVDSQQVMLLCDPIGKKKDNTLHRAIINGSIDIIKLLLQYRASTETLNSHGMTPLHLAVQQNNPMIVKLLLEYGADVNCYGACGLTALDLAVDHGNAIIVQTLLENGANPRKG